MSCVLFLYPGSIHLWVVGLFVSSPICGWLFRLLSTVSLTPLENFCSSLVPKHSSFLYSSYYGDMFTLQIHECAIFIIVLLYNHRFSFFGSVILCYFIALGSVYGKTVSLLRTQLKLVSLNRMCLYFTLSPLMMFWFIGGPWQAVLGQTDWGTD